MNAVRALLEALIGRARGRVEDAAVECLQFGRLLPPELRVASAVLWPLRTLRVWTLPAPEVALHDDWVDVLPVADGGLDDEESTGL